MHTLSNRLPLDPWAASSLLQKAIRRGETALARLAATTLHRQRGVAVWRRLATVAIEDIGIADPSLVGEVSRLATDKDLRSILGSESDLLNEVCMKLAAAPKDRSADYLYCASVAALRNGSANAEPLIRDAAEALSICTSAANPMQLKESAVRQFVAGFDGLVPDALKDSVLRLVGSGGHPFKLMLLPLWVAFSASKERTLSTETVPEAAFVRGVPLYTWDKHTAVGKRAISRFARENQKVARTLTQWVSESHRTEVALIAAFYADAIPVAQRLDWAHSQALYEAGREADMVGAGCPKRGILPVLECVRRELSHLNELRRAVLTGR